MNVMVLSSEELITHVRNDAAASEREIVLIERLAAALDEVTELEDALLQRGPDGQNT